MRYLVDTQAFIWFSEDDPPLPTHIRALMEGIDSEPVISIASLWEMTIKMSLGKLILSGDIAAMLNKVIDNGFAIMPIEGAHLITLSTLDFFHRDPFDRIIISQSISEDMLVISSDTIFSRYPVTWVWNK
ncbi:type II toxin-antitoxin system VapC family toxin [Breznakiellaceae bacterium SP9]